MSTQLKNCTFGDKVLNEDANQSVGDFNAGTITVSTINEPRYIVLYGTTYELSVSEYGWLKLTPVG